MCELLGLSSSHPVNVNLSLGRLARHGGGTGPHAHGWGVAWYQDGDVRRIRDSRAAYDNPWVRFVQEQDLLSTTIVAHIRQATQGAVSLRNTQPFQRELGGCVHVFAHNGKFAALPPANGPGQFRPIGETDSELAFCMLMDRMRALWARDTRPPALERRCAAFAAFAAELRPLGPANILYSDGEVLFAHAHRRSQADGAIRPPGLVALDRHCPIPGRPWRCDGLNIEPSGYRQDVLLLASVPLSDEAWRPLDEGTVLVVKDGMVVAQC